MAFNDEFVFEVNQFDSQIPQTVFDTHPVRNQMRASFFPAFSNASIA